MSHLSDIKLDDRNLPPPTTEIEQERKVAIFDLLEKNTFKLPKKANKGIIKGPFNLSLAIKDKNLMVQISALCLNQLKLQMKERENHPSHKHHTSHEHK